MNLFISTIIYIMGLLPVEKEPLSCIHHFDSVDPCRIYGMVYFTKNKSEANASIYIEEDEAGADVLIYKEDNQSLSKQSGHWYITTTKEFADYIIYVEKNESYADFHVYYTDIESFAGCQ